MSSSIAIVADGHPDAGLGHLARCTGLACALALAHVDVGAFALGAMQRHAMDGVRWTPCPDGPPDVSSDTLLVLDSYRLGEPQRARLLADAAATVSFDEADTDAQLVISPHGKPAPGRLTGLDHACLRRDFWVAVRPPIRREIGQVLVSVGGGPFAALRAGVADDVLRALPDARVRVAGAGPGETLPDGAEGIAPATLAHELRAADLVVTAGGQTALEAAACGVPTIVFAIVDNQRQQVERLRERGAGRVINDRAAVSSAVAALASDEAARRDLAARARAAVDGLGALRSASEVLSLAARPTGAL